MGQGEPPRRGVTYLAAAAAVPAVVHGAVSVCRCTTGAELSVRAPRRHLEAAQQGVTHAEPAGVMGPAETLRRATGCAQLRSQPSSGSGQLALGSMFFSDTPVR